MRYLIVFIVMILATTQAMASCSQPIRSAWNHWPPYAMSDSKGNAAGLDVELLQRIALEAGCKLQWSAHIPSKRQQMYMVTGEQDIQFAASVTPDREKFAWFSPSYRTEKIVLFVNQGAKNVTHKAIKTLPALVAQKIGVIAPFQGWYGQEYEKIWPILEQNAQLRRYKTTEQALELLKNLPTNVAIGDFYSFIYTAKQLQQPIPDMLDVLVNEGSIHLMYSKKSMSIQDVAAFNQAIKRLQQTGELTKIITSYGLHP